MNRNLTVKYDDSGRILVVAIGNNVKAYRSYAAHPTAVNIKTGELADHHKVGLVRKAPKEIEGMSDEQIKRGFRVSRVDGEMVDLEQV